MMFPTYIKRKEIPVTEMLDVVATLIAQCRAKRKYVLATKPASKSRTEYVEQIRRERQAYERVYGRLKRLRWTECYE